MILKRVFTTYTFRFMVSYVIVLSIAVFTLLAMVYAVYSYGQFHQVRGQVEKELNTLERLYATAGKAGVDRYVAEKNRTRKLNPFFYLLVDEQRQKQAGDLESWPRFYEFGRGWLSFERDVLTWDAGEENLELIARVRELPDGHRLLVARDYSDLLLNAQLMFRMMLSGTLIMIVLGMIGGAWTSLAMVRELEAINRSVSTIMKGDLSERIPISGRGGDMELLVANFNRMLDQIQTLMDGVRQVTDNIAHDLRTPLTRLRNHLRELERRCAEDNREDVQAMIAEADGLLATFSGLLRIAQVESGHRRAGFQPNRLRAILQDVVELYEPLAQERRQRLNLALEGDPKIMGDRDLLFQMIANLVDNAIKYTPEGGAIDVSLRSRGGWCQLVVADSGEGIPAGHRDRVFERFYRVEASRREPGNGLGMSLVAAVVRLHDGAVLLEDNRPGLRVVVNLPESTFQSLTDK